jgi:hypothetical protein
MARLTTSKVLLGWREWVQLPALHLTPIRAKIDTGARSCALHAFYVERFRRAGGDWVRFGMHPLVKRQDLVVHCEARLVDRRIVTDSGGHREQRCVIETTLLLGDHRVDAEVTLTDRETMQFRMLVGRNALRGFVVDPHRSFALGRVRPAVAEDFVP